MTIKEDMDVKFKYISALSVPSARVALREAYSATLADVLQRNEIIEEDGYTDWEQMLVPFLEALPHVVRGSHEDEESRLLLFEIIGMTRALVSRRALYRRFKGRSSAYLESSVRKNYLPLADIYLPDVPRFKDVRALSSHGGIWLLLADRKLVTELWVEDPVGTLNAMAEILHYAKRVTLQDFKVTSGTLNILKTFLRSV